MKFTRRTELTHTPASFKVTYFLVKTREIDARLGNIDTILIKFDQILPFSTNYFFTLFHSLHF